MSYFNSYHNTADAHGSRLRKYEKTANDQEASIRAFFDENWWADFTPSEVWREVLPEAPLTSVRRAMTNLTRSGVLVKTETQRTGPYGRPEYAWRLR